jgi:hypothetical protein
MNIIFWIMVFNIVHVYLLMFCRNLLPLSSWRSEEAACFSGTLINIYMTSMGHVSEANNLHAKEASTHNRYAPSQD